MAKSKKKQGTESKPPVDSTFEIGTYERKMKAAHEHLCHELTGVRTGRISPTLLDGIMVDLHGDKCHLPHLATVLVAGPRTLALTVYDRDTTKAIIAGIRDSPLQLNPREESGKVIVPIPEMSPETRKAMVKLAHQHAEHARVVVRQARHKAMSDLKALGKSISEDDKRRCEKMADEATRKYIQEVDNTLKSKEQELEV